MDISIVLSFRLEEKYEEHPLVNAFNVYLQTFLSQALEPGFLIAIRESNGKCFLTLQTICSLLLP